MSESTSHPGSSTRQSSPIRFLIPLIAVAVVVLFWAQFNRRAGDSPTTNAAIGKACPQLDLIDLNSGDPMEISSSGKVTLLHFWGTWCGPCRMEYPHLSKAAAALAQNPGFQFVPVSSESDSGETVMGLAKKTNAYFDREGITSPALADPRGVTRRSAAERLEQPSLYYPTSMLIDNEGKIVGVWEGFSPDAVNQIATQSEKLLGSFESPRSGSVAIR